MRDGAFDIGMFRSYWERAARITGERIADLSARPMAPSPESHDHRPEVETGAADPSESMEPETAPIEPLSHLSGLISRVLESADQLAASTRRTRKADRGGRVTAAEPGTAEHVPE